METTVAHSVRLLNVVYGCLYWVCVHVIPSLCHLRRRVYSPSVFGLQHRVAQPADVATCCSLLCFQFLVFLINTVIINTLAMAGITRTPSKNIMPVLDTGHLLMSQRYAGHRRVGWGGVRRGLKGSWEEGEERRRRDDLTTCSGHKELFFSAGSWPWTGSPGQILSLHWALTYSAVNSHCDL